jgi:hypothetical protein
MAGYIRIDRHVAEGNVDRILRDRAIYGYGSRGQLPSFYRYVIIDVIFDPQIIDKTKLDYWEHTLGVSNMEWATVLPRNSIIAQRVYDAGEEPPVFLFPFFPSHMALPCKPGEHVWVMFEAPGSGDASLGYWFCKITEPHHVDDVNHTHAPRAFDPSFTPSIKDVFNGNTTPKYEFRNGRPEEQDGERYTDAESSVLPGGDELAYEKLLTDPDGSQLSQYEVIPRYRKRPSDMVLEGSNNTLIVLGTDRTGPASDNTSLDPQKGIIPKKPASDVDGASGTIDIVTGRGQTSKTLGKEVTSKKIDGSDFIKELGKSSQELIENEGDPDWKADRSRILVSQRTHVDKNMGIDEFNQSNFPDATNVPGSGLKDSTDGDGAILIRTDKVRIIARMDVEFLVSGYEKDAKGNVIALTDPDQCAAIVIRSNGDIVFKPSKSGYVKLGGDDADKGIVCSDMPVVANNGGVSGAPLMTTMGGAFAGAVAGTSDNSGALAPGQAKFANKVLAK